MQAAIRTGELVHWELSMTLMVNKVDDIQSGFLCIQLLKCQYRWSLVNGRTKLGSLNWWIKWEL